MKTGRNTEGFSLIELLIAMTVVLVVLGLASTILMKALGTRSRESRRVDALSTSQAALNVISREIANSGYGLKTNGLVSADSASQKIRLRANLVNDNNCTTESGEDVTYFYDASSESIVRTERSATTPCGTSFQTNSSVVVNRISNITFQYFSSADGAPSVQTGTPDADTGRVKITLEVRLEDVNGQPSNQTVVLQSDVALRNSEYMLKQF